MLSLNIGSATNWYRFLNGSSTALMTRESEDKRRNGLTVCYARSSFPGNPPTGKTQRIFHTFSSYLEFYRFDKLLNDTHRNFFEVIFPFPQKLYFDIDVKEDVTGEIGLRVYQRVISICAELIPLNPTRDILVFSSNGVNRSSYHVVINNWCVSDNKQAEYFYNQVIDKLALSPEDTKTVDKLYKSIQQYRIVGSQKEGSGRPKQLLSSFILNGQSIEHVYEINLPHILLYESLVSVTYECKTLPGFNVTPTPIIPRENISQPSVLGAVNLLSKKFPSPPYNFKVLKVEGNRIDIIFDKPKPKCPSCNVLHEHQNPALYTIPEIDGMEVYYFCRRTNIENRYFLGKIPLTTGCKIPTGSMIVPLDTGCKISIGSIPLDTGCKISSESKHVTPSEFKPRMSRITALKLIDKFN